MTRRLVFPGCVLLRVANLLSANSYCVMLSIGPGVVGLKRRGDKNIVLPTWVRDCVKELRLIPLNPKYMLFTTKETEKEFRLIMDEYEDSYTEPLSTGALQEVCTPPFSVIRNYRCTVT